MYSLIQLQRAAELCDRLIAKCKFPAVVKVTHPTVAYEGRHISCKRFDPSVIGPDDREYFLLLFHMVS